MESTGEHLLVIGGSTAHVVLTTMPSPWRSSELWVLPVPAMT